MRRGAAPGWHGAPRRGGRRGWVGRGVGRGGLLRCGANDLSLLRRRARVSAPLRSVSPHYVSFALDSPFIRDPTGIGGLGPLPQDDTNSTRIDFQNPLLNKVMPLVTDGFIRIGGTYTDFVHYYVPGSNHTRCPYAPHKQRCPGNSIPCCLPMTVERWREALEFAHRNGLQIVFNLNVLHGRYDDYSAAIPNCCGAFNGTRPPWDSSEARALMTWTKENVEPKMWPAYFGLGNELSGYLSAEQWAGDLHTVYSLIKEIFGGTPGSGRTPGTYGPCNCDGASVWEADFLKHSTSLQKDGLGAFTFHSYAHHGATVEGVANMTGGIDASRNVFAKFKALHSAADTTSALWITETAWSATATANAAAGGAAAAVNGMERACDMAWNLDALGAAAEEGVDVFCRETLAGDWLEVIGSWQPGDARTGEHNPPYTPHADFWVAALWKKLMGLQVLGANSTAVVAAEDSAVQVRTFAHCSKRTAGAVTQHPQCCQLRRV